MYVCIGMYVVQVAPRGRGLGGLGQQPLGLLPAVLLACCLPTDRPAGRPATHGAELSVCTHTRHKHGVEHMVRMWWVASRVALGCVEVRFFCFLINVILVLGGSCHDTGESTLRMLGLAAPPPKDQLYCA